jgi:hypothetical protein
MIFWRRDFFGPVFSAGAVSLMKRLYFSHEIDRLAGVINQEKLGTAAICADCAGAYEPAEVVA